MDMRYIRVFQDNDYSLSHIPRGYVINNNETNANMEKESMGHSSLTSCKQNVMLDYSNKLHHYYTNIWTKQWIVRDQWHTQSMVQKCTVFRSPTPQQDIHQSKWSSHSPVHSEYTRDTSLKNKHVSISWKLQQNFDHLRCSQHPNLSINYQNNKKSAQLPLWTWI
jgi:hypothetical protein